MNHATKHDLSIVRRFQLVYPVCRYQNMSTDRLDLIDFYESVLEQVIYSKRSTSIESLIEHTKSTFRIGSILVRRYNKVSVIVLLYWILVHYNYKIKNDVLEQSST